MTDRIKDSELLERAKMRKIPFSVPEGYFQSVEQRLQEKCFNTPVQKRGLLITSLKAGLTLAASFLIVAGLGWGVMRLTNNVQQANLAENSQIQLSEEGQIVMDSLISKFGAIEVAEMYHYSNTIDIPETVGLTDEEYLAIEEYISLMAPSFPGLLAEELSNK